MLRYNLREIFKLRNITKPHRFLMNAGISRMVAYKFLYNDVYVLKLDHIEKLCISLRCTPNDILQYIPNKPLNPESPQPIEKLIKKSEEFENIPNMLNSFNLEQIREVNTIITNYRDDQYRKSMAQNKRKDDPEPN